MKARGRKCSIFYFESEGRENLGKVLSLVKARVMGSTIHKVIVFTRDGEGPLRAAEMLQGVQIVAVTFPYKQRFRDSERVDNGESIVPGTSSPEVVRKLVERGIRLVRGTMPFQPVVIPYAKDPKIEGIKHALCLFGTGMSLCIQSILMATDAGEVEPGEEVAAMSADTAIVATGALSHWLFHPEEGMEVREIVCKPRVLTVSKNRKPSQDG
ncbi:MAG: hypothetical protein NUV93_07030 [Firmicutes bacterium]|jgi:hypothetical protein|nr:hypothetical protein [Bacillota bacterium]